MRTKPYRISTYQKRVLKCLATGNIFIRTYEVHPDWPYLEEGAKYSRGDYEPMYSMSFEALRDHDLIVYSEQDDGWTIGDKGREALERASA